MHPLISIIHHIISNSITILKHNSNILYFYFTKSKYNCLITMLYNIAVK